MLKRKIIKLEILEKSRGNENYILKLTVCKLAILGNARETRFHTKNTKLTRRFILKQNTTTGEMYLTFRFQPRVN